MSESDVISGFTVCPEFKTNLRVTLIPVYSRTARPEVVVLLGAAGSQCMRPKDGSGLGLQCIASQLLLWSRADFLLEFRVIRFLAELV